MNLILLFKTDFISDTRVRLTDRRRDHITTVLKSKVGDRLCVGQCDEQIGVGDVKSIGDFIELDVQFNVVPPKALPLTLILALPRPHLLKRSLFFASMLGIKDIHLVHFQRVEKSLWNSSSLKPEIIKEHLVLGLEQAKDTMMPKVALHQEFKTFIKEVLPDLVKDRLSLVAHPGGQGLGGAPQAKPLTLVIGPEGGIIDNELEILGHAGFDQVDLGARIMRVDACIPYIVAKLF